MIPHVDTVLLKVASRCNINCRYCYVYNKGDTGWKNQPPSMSKETIDSLTDGLKSQLDLQKEGFAVVLHGGEPFLLGKERLSYLLQKLRESLSAKCTISIQTNGTLLDQDFLKICSNHQVRISVSLDGPKGINDQDRVTHQNGGTFEKALSGINLLKSHPDSENLFSGTLSVVNPNSEPNEIYSFFKELKTPSMDFLLQDGNHSRLPQWKKGFESVEYGSWMSKLFDLYVSDPEPVPIRVFDDYLKLLLGGRGSKEGMGGQAYSIIIIDTDGSITKNDTLKSTVHGADQFPEPWNINTHSLSEIIQTESFQEYLQLQIPLSKICRDCSDLFVCGGGMPLYRWKDENGYDNPSVFCNDHKTLINQLRDYLDGLS